MIQKIERKILIFIKKKDISHEQKSAVTIFLNILRIQSTFEIKQSPYRLQQTPFVEIIRLSRL